MLGVGWEWSEVALKGAGWEALPAGAVGRAQPGRAPGVAAAPAACTPAPLQVHLPPLEPAQAVHAQPLPQTAHPTQRHASRMASGHACLEYHFWTQTAAMA